MLVTSYASSSSLLSGGMSSSSSSRYARRTSPPIRYSNPARSSTGTFIDPYLDPAYHARAPSPRLGGERGSSSKYQSTYYVPTGSSGNHSTSSKHESEGARPRRNTIDPLKSNSTSLTSLPFRSSYAPVIQYDRAEKSRNKRAETYITQTPTKGHKKVYSVDDASRKTQLIADIEPARHRSNGDRGYSITSGNRSYYSNSKSAPRGSELGDDGYSYTDPAGMYRDTEPAWRRRRSGSLEPGSSPPRMIMDHPARSSARALGPPPSTRGFDKLEKAGSWGYGRSPSSDRSSREISRYDSYSDTGSSHPLSAGQHAPAAHQDRHEYRRDTTHHDEYDRRDRQAENKRYNGGDRFEDRHVAARGFGISPVNSAEHHISDRQPVRDADEKGGAARSENLTDQRYSTAYPPNNVRVPESRASHDRAPDGRQDSYDNHPRDRYDGRQDSKGHSSSIPVTGAAAASSLGTAAYMNSYEKDRGRDGDTDSSKEQRRGYEDRDRSDRREDHRDRGFEERRDDKRDIRSEDRRDAPPSLSANGLSSGYVSTRDEERRARERRYEEDECERTERKALTLQSSEDVRSRSYSDRDVEHQNKPASKEADLDPDEEYRRRIQQEADRNSRGNREREQHSDSDRDEERRRRRDERDRARSFENGPSATTSRSREDASRHDARSSNAMESRMALELQPSDALISKSVQIVEPSKGSPPPVKGILRKPTEKFPEDPEPIREGVAPHKDALKGKDIPVGARWTRIDRRLVNPEALEDAKERFEERMDCVIVLRVLTKQEIQRLADRTRKIRETRDDQDRYDRDERSSRNHKEDRGYENQDRERRRRSDDDNSDYDDQDRKYEHERDRD